MTRLTDSRSAPEGAGLPAGASPGPGSSRILTSEKYLEDAHASSRSHMAAPASLISDAIEGNTCAIRDLRFISLLARSWTLLVLSLFQCDGGKSRYARALGSASSSTSAALGHAPRSMSRATWYMATRGPGAGLARAVADEADHAALPGGALEDIAQGVHQAPVGVGDDEAHARGAAGADPA